MTTKEGPKLRLRRIVSLVVLASLCTVFAFLAQGAMAATTTVEMQDSKFVPDPITVNVGDTVTFKNTGALPHTAETKDGTFNTGNVNAGQSKDVVMKKAGTFKYICLYHESTGMVGTIEVKGADGAAAPVAEPSPSPEPTAAASPTATEDAEAAAAKPPTEKYFPIIGVALLALMFGGIGMGFLKNILKGIESRK